MGSGVNDRLDRDPDETIPGDQRSYLSQKVTRGDIIFGIIGAVVLLLALHHYDETFRGLPVVRVAIIPIALLLVVGIHEAGHVAAGLAIGWRFLFCAIGPILIIHADRRVTIRIVPLRGLPVGLACCVPRRDHRVRVGLILMIGGGPTASLLLAGLCAGIAWMRLPTYANSPSGYADSALMAFLMATACLSAVILLLATIPYAAGGFDSDGRRLWHLLRGRRAADIDVALFVLEGDIASGRRPRNWNPSLVETVASTADGSAVGLGGSLCAHSYWLDVGDFGKAEMYLERGLAHYQAADPIQRPALALAAACFEADRRKNAHRARQWLQRAKGPWITRWSIHLAEAGILVLEGKGAEGRRMANQASKAMEQANIKPCEASWARLKEIARRSQEICNAEMPTTEADGMTPCDNAP